MRVITLNRPERRNAFIPAMVEDMNQSLADAGRDPAVRAVVLTGAGGQWSVGVDRSRLEAVASAGGSEHTEDLGRWDAPRRVPKPVIAAIEGACAGVAMVIALTCDVRIAARDSIFSTAYSRIGLVAERGLAWLLMRTCSMGTALDLLLSSRKVTGEEAQRLGLVSRLAEPGEARAHAIAYATELAESSSPWAMAVIKEQVWRDAGEPYAMAVNRSIELARLALKRREFRQSNSGALSAHPDLPDDWTAP